MSLSNTATPKYYGEYRDAVIRGEFPVCKTIALQMERIDERIRNPRYYYDSDAVEGWIKFCERELTLTDGSDLTLLPIFKVWAEDVYGWYYFLRRSVYVPNKDGHGGHYENRLVKRRLTNKQYLIVARGSAKTMYLSGHQGYGLVVDRSTTTQVATAPVVYQAEETLKPLKTALGRARGPLFKLMTEGSIQNTTGNLINRPKLSSTKKGIENFMTNSILKVIPMEIDKLQGLQNKYSTIDEWLSVDIREDVMGALEQGASKIDDYIIIAASSEGTIRNGIGDSIKMELMSILRGEYFAPNVSIWWYQLDDISEVANPEMWIKANPNIGITVSYEAYQRDVERAENNPSARNDILAKRFNIPLEGYTYFFTYEETIPSKKKRDFWGMPCSMGIDLSQGDDFCAFTFMFPLISGEFGVKTRSYISERTLMLLPSAMRIKYNQFINEGTLVVMEGGVLDMTLVYDDLDTHIQEQQYDVRCVGYDPYNAKAFIERWCRENGEYGVEKVIQGAKTESVPLGEMKKLTEDRMFLFDEELMSFALGNCIVLEDTNGNRKLYKKRRDQKIDNVAALMDAYVSYKINKDFFE